MNPINTIHKRWLGSHMLKTNISLTFQKTDVRRNMILSGILNSGGLSRRVRCPLNDWAQIIYIYSLFSPAIRNFKRKTTA